jgi:alpha-L-fucosidase 2
LRDLLAPVDGKGVSCDGGGSYPNLFCAHPPFQIDGNLGGAAAIAEMLLQSHRQTKSTTGAPIFEIHLLPALPSAWSSGIVRGLRARGGFELNLSWERGELAHVHLHSEIGGTCLLRWHNQRREVTLAAGERFYLDLTLLKT